MYLNKKEKIDNQYYIQFDDYVNMVILLVQFIESLIRNLSSPAPEYSKNKMGNSDIVLVAGATGGVGRRVVDILRMKGIPVRVLVTFLT